MKYLFVLFALFSPSVHADPLAKPAFPSTLPNASASLEKIGATVLAEPAAFYCEEAKNVELLIEKISKPDERFLLEQEIRFSMAVCKDLKYIGLKEHGMDSNSGVIANAEVVKQGLFRFFVVTKSIPGQGTMSQFWMSRLERDYNLFLRPQMEKAYNPNGEIDLSKPVSDIHSWVRQIREWYSSAN